MKIIDDNLMNGLAEEAKKSPKPTKDIYLVVRKKGKEMALRKITLQAKANDLLTK